MTVKTCGHIRSVVQYSRFIIVLQITLINPHIPPGAMARMYLSVRQITVNLLICYFIGNGRKAIPLPLGFHKNIEIQFLAFIFIQELAPGALGDYDFGQLAENLDGPALFGVY